MYQPCYHRKALELWPQYYRHIVTDARGKHHVHLNVFEYFAFWTAFYVLRSSQVSGSYNPQSAPKGYGHLAPSLGSVRKVRGYACSNLFAALCSPKTYHRGTKMGDSPDFPAAEMGDSV